MKLLARTLVYTLVALLIFSTWTIKPYYQFYMEKVNSNEELSLLEAVKITRMLMEVDSYVKNNEKISIPFGNEAVLILDIDVEIVNVNINSKTDITTESSGDIILTAIDNVKADTKTMSCPVSIYHSLNETDSGWELNPNGLDMGNTEDADPIQCLGISFVLLVLEIGHNDADPVKDNPMKLKI